MVKLSYLECATCMKTFLTYATICFKVDTRDKITRTVLAKNLKEKALKHSPGPLSGNGSSSPYLWYLLLLNCLRPIVEKNNRNDRKRRNKKSHTPVMVTAEPLLYVSMRCGTVRLAVPTYTVLRNASATDKTAVEWKKTSSLRWYLAMLPELRKNNEFTDEK